MNFNKNRFNKKRVRCFSKTMAISIAMALILLGISWCLSKYIETRTTALDVLVSQKEQSSEASDRGIVYGSPFLDQFFGIPLKANYAEADNVADTNILYNDFAKYCDNYKGMFIGNDNRCKTSEITIRAKQRLFDSFLSYFEMPMDNNDMSRIRNAFFLYTKYENVF